MKHACALIYKRSAAPIARSRIGGGIDADAEGGTYLAEEFGILAQISITEVRKYAYHRKNRTAARVAKKFHGSRCQACDLDFGERYGKIGQDFIEAHHLRPIATLEEGQPVSGCRLCGSLFQLS